MPLGKEEGLVLGLLVLSLVLLLLYLSVFFVFLFFFTVCVPKLVSISSGLCSNQLDQSNLRTTERSDQLLSALLVTV